jgi:hypothetical protein
LKLLCKRTFFKENLNFYPVEGKLYGNEYVAFQNGKIYQYKEPEDYEKSVGVYLIVESERKDFWLPVKKSEFDKHFINLEENRNRKIDEILNRQ